jgi:hypothetical protein
MDPHEKRDNSVAGASVALAVTSVVVLTPEQVADLVRLTIEQTLAAHADQPEAPAGDDPQLLSYRKAAEMCSCSPSTLRRRARSGELAVVNSLGRPKFRKRDIERLIQQGADPQ